MPHMKSVFPASVRSSLHTVTGRIRCIADFTPNSQELKEISDQTGCPTSAITVGNIVNNSAFCAYCNGITYYCAKNKHELIGYSNEDPTYSSIACKRDANIYEEN